MFAKKRIMNIENKMSCIICQHRCHDPVIFHFQVSDEDTPATAGMLAKKLPVFRDILIEVSCNADSR